MNSSVISKLADMGIKAEEFETTKNGVICKGIRVITGSPVCPVIYRTEAESDDKFVERIAYIASQDDTSFDVAKLSDREYVRQNAIVTMQKISEENVVKKAFLDLEAVVRIVVSDGKNIGSAKITPELQRTLNLSLDELFDCAITNMRTRFNIKSMAEIIGLPEEMSTEFPMYVVSTDTNAYGASAILMPEVFAEFCRQKGVEKCTILPSSTEELILLPGSENDAESLVQMVADVNRTQVDPMIQLNPSVYIFNCRTGKISIAASF